MSWAMSGGYAPQAARASSNLLRSGGALKVTRSPGPGTSRKQQDESEAPMPMNCSGHSRGEHRPLGLKALRVLLPFVRPQWRSLALAPSAAVATSLVGLLKPWPFKFLIDDVFNVGRPGHHAVSPAVVITAVSISIVVIALLQGLLSFAKEFFLSATTQRVAFALRSALFTHIQRLPLSFHDRQHTGDMITRL